MKFQAVVVSATVGGSREVAVRGSGLGMIEGGTGALADSLRRRRNVSPGEGLASRAVVGWICPTLLGGGSGGPRSASGRVGSGSDNLPVCVCNLPTPSTATPASATTTLNRRCDAHGRYQANRKANANNGFR